jgi:hypothetical protein
VPERRFFPAACHSPTGPACGVEVIGSQMSCPIDERESRLQLIEADGHVGIGRSHAEQDAGDRGRWGRVQGRRPARARRLRRGVGRRPSEDRGCVARARSGRHQTGARRPARGSSCMIASRRCSSASRSSGRRQPPIAVRPADPGRRRTKRISGPGRQGPPRRHCEPAIRAGRHGRKEVSGLVEPSRQREVVGWISG